MQISARLFFEADSKKVIAVKNNNTIERYEVLVRKHDNNTFSVVNKEGDTLFYFFRKLKQLRSYHKRERGVGLTPDRSISTESDLVSWMKTEKPVHNSEVRLEAEATMQEKEKFYTALTKVYPLTRSSQETFARFTIK